MMWTKGDDYKEGNCEMVYGIDKGQHGNAVEVYSSEEDRDLILKFLQELERRSKNVL